MVDLTVWKKQQVRELKDDLDRLFAEFARDFGDELFVEMSGEAPFLELSETEQDLKFSAHIPDIATEDLELGVSTEYILFEGKKGRRLNHRNGSIRQCRRFFNKIRLPCRVEPEKVKAYWKDGILQVILPKSRGPKFHKVTIVRLG